MRLLFIAMIMMLCAGAGQAQESENEKPQALAPHEKLLELYDKNELATAYYRFCVTTEKLPPPQFMDNAGLITAALQEAVLKAFPEKTADDVEGALIRRAEYLQRVNTQRRIDQGCDAPWAQSAQKYYDMLGTMEADMLQGFIRNRIEE